MTNVTAYKTNFDPAQYDVLSDPFTYFANLDNNDKIHFTFPTMALNPTISLTLPRADFNYASCYIDNDSANQVFYFLEYTGTNDTRTGYTYTARQDYFTSLSTRYTSTANGLKIMSGVQTHGHIFMRDFNKYGRQIITPEVGGLSAVQTFPLASGNLYHGARLMVRYKVQSPQWFGEKGEITFISESIQLNSIPSQESFIKTLSNCWRAANVYRYLDGDTKVYTGLVMSGAWIVPSCFSVPIYEPYYELIISPDETIDNTTLRFASVADSSIMSPAYGQETWINPSSGGENSLYFGKIIRVGTNNIYHQMPMDNQRHYINFAPFVQQNGSTVAFLMFVDGNTYDLTPDLELPFTINTANTEATQTAINNSLALLGSTVTTVASVATGNPIGVILGASGMVSSAMRFEKPAHNSTQRGLGLINLHPQGGVFKSPILINRFAAFSGVWVQMFTLLNKNEFNDAVLRYGMEGLNAWVDAALVMSEYTTNPYEYFQFSQITLDRRTMSGYKPIPAEGYTAIENLFKRGIRIWKSNATMYQYPDPSW